MAAKVVKLTFTRERIPVCSCPTHTAYGIGGQVFRYRGIDYDCPTHGPPRLKL